MKFHNMQTFSSMLENPEQKIREYLNRNIQTKSVQNSFWYHASNSQKLLRDE